MEPAAPGTEENFRVVPSNYNKKEQEQERLLSIKAKLPNGRYGNVFEHSIQSGSDHWYCNLCSCPVMGRIYHHEIGKRHTSNMQASSTGTATKTPDIDASETPILIAPGEPIPPGYEDKDTIAQIQERLDSFTVDPLIGLEYIFEITEDDIEKEPQYLCILCDKRGDPRTVMSHLASFKHTVQYLQRHFLTCYRALSPYSAKQYKRSWQTAVQKIAEAIESKYGRLKPHVVEKGVFEKKKNAFVTMIAKGPHFNERPGLTFEELIVQEEMIKVHDDDVGVVVKRNYRKTGTNPNNNTKLSAATSATGEKLSSISGSDLSDFDPGQPPSPKKNKSNEQPRRDVNRNKPSFKKQRYSPVRENKRFETLKHSNLPNRNRNNERFEKSREKTSYRARVENQMADRSKPKFDKNSEFTRLAFGIERDMERIIIQNQKHPEQHSQYNEEWKKFWNQRYKQLQAEGKNPAGHDFKPEWIDYWNKRLKEIHDIELKSKKDALRKRLGLPEEPASICFRITGKKKPGERDDTRDSKLAPMASTPDLDPDVILIDDKDSPEEKSAHRSRSPWETEPGRMSRRSRESRSRSRDRRPTRNHSRIRRSHSREREREIEWSNRVPYHDYPREQAYYRSEYPEYVKPPRVMRDATRHPVVSPSLAMHHNPTEPELEHEDDGDINIVSILRLLTALEEKLGSLGPKVIDLLSQALAMEKDEANSSEALLDNDINCVMFETVKEKLKGQLLAGLVSFAQEKAFKIAIKKLASLLHFAGERKKEKEKGKPKIDPIQVPGIGKVDKAAIAKQIAAALIVQGKTDVTQGELEQLINAVVGMAEASQGSGKPITTASFLQQLTQQKQPSVDKVESSSGAFKNIFQAASESATVIPTTNMEGLSDTDLQTLLQNFKDLCTDEQHSLISYLKKLEAREPERVERLRKFVRVEAQSETIEKDSEPLFDKSDEETNGKLSPFANRFAGTNPTSDDNSQNKFENIDKQRIKDKVTIDSDEEDYTFEDVFKAADKNIRDKEEKEEQERLLEKTASDLKKEDFDLSVAKSLMANIMGQFRSKTETAPATNPAMPAFVPPPKPPGVPLPVNFPNPSFLDNISINIANLTNALNAAQQIKPSRPQIPFQPNQPQIPFEPPITNPNLFSLEPRSYPNQDNSHSNNFPLRALSPQNVSHLPRHQDSGIQQQFGGFKSLFDSLPAQQDQNPSLLMGNNSDHGSFNRSLHSNQFDLHPARKTQISSLMGNNSHRGNFNAPSHSNQFERSPEYNYDYENRW